ncbi:oxalate decarboxylase [Cristinia sonorae]|uniref:Oxalate decarboxylase n=1 Tax=Cristinia sonorae TaxID=1940300 RepID=A0A8K0XQ38_9AGAR|nr:oxalate decarboxylase [Cristinia sonorae]
MPLISSSVLVSVLLFSFTLCTTAAPSGLKWTRTESSSSPSPTVPYASDSPNDPLWGPLSNIYPQAQRGTLGATILGPHNVPLELENPSLLAPPTTDHGSVMNAKWPFSLSHNRLQTGGWARQQTIEDMPIAKDREYRDIELAGVNMRLEAGAIRELHWHKTAEWAYVLKGSTQISTVTSEGQNYVATVNPGDLWYFPPGQPHSLQATADNSEGSEFLLVFDDGHFSEDGTFLLTDWLAHVPKEVIAKNFQTSLSAFNHIPSEELYIFPSTAPADDQQPPLSPFGMSKPFTYEFSKVNATQFSGGTFKVADSRTFKAAEQIAVAEVTVEPGAMRELHWHPTQDEWTFFIEGSARMTLFAAEGNARTYDYQAGDIGYVPASFGHYVENTGNTTLHFLEIYKSDRVQDISLSQWLALTPPDLVKAHLDLSDETIAQLRKEKLRVVGGRH